MSKQIKRYILAAPDYSKVIEDEALYNSTAIFGSDKNLSYGSLFRNRSPIIKVCDGKIIEPEYFNLEGLDLLDWIKTNPDKLNYTVGSDYMAGHPTEWETVNYYRDDWVLHELLLDDDEEFNILSESSDEEYFRDVRQYNNLVENLIATFKTVEPDKNHERVFGLSYRELILLASMEVEIHWKALLTENGYLKERTTTRDYIKPKQFINFDCSYLLSSYPGFPLLFPFQGWNENSPTESLVWYDAYNKIKHNRTEYIKLANLKNALLSIAAVHKLLIIRYCNRNPAEQFRLNILCHIQYNTAQKYPALLRFEKNLKRIKYFDRIQ